MILVIDNHPYQYETEKLCRIFYPTDKIRTVFSPEEAKGDHIITSLSDDIISTQINIGGKKSVSRETVRDKNDIEMQLAGLLVRELSKITGITPEWGVLTGIRPSKIMMDRLEKTSEKEALEHFEKRFLVSREKAELALKVAKREKRITEKAVPRSVNLYVSIPFCPTRCNYCSFVSHSIEKTVKLMEPYIENLCREIEITGKIVKEEGLRLDTVYFGGGTPTTLDEYQLDTILSCIEDNFDLSDLLEYTVEAGRPDTVSSGKLRTLKKHNVGRISINPQTFNQQVLDNIGRKHTVEDIYKAFFLARECGFDNINMDLIAGLTGDTYESFCQSVDSAVKLQPENITVHTLSLKSSSYLVTEREKVGSSGALAAQMVNFAGKTLEKNDYMAYYMYRQSKSLGNLENVGWCKENRECLYNIFMMEECASVFSCGAGAVTKLVSPRDGKIERIFNYKYPYEYNDRFSDITKRKKRITEFFSEYK